MAVTAVIAKLGRVLTRHGVTATLVLLRELLSRQSYRLCLMGLTARDARVLTPLSDRLVAHIASRAEVESLRAEGWLDADSLERMAKGDRCLVQRVGGTLAGVGWLATRPDVELGPGIPLRVPPDAGYTYRSWTHPEFRGHGLQARRALAFLDLVQQEGRSRLMLFARRTKFESLKGVRKAGYRPIGGIDVRQSGDVASWRIRITDPAWSELLPESGERGQCAIAEDIPDPPRMRS